MLQSVVYRSKNGGAYSIVGIVEGMDGAFVDWGLFLSSYEGDNTLVAAMTEFTTQREHGQLVIDANCGTPMV